MSNTVKQLGFIPTNRGEFDTTGQTRYYKDNVVQYRNGSYICSPVGYSSSNPTAYTTDAPYQDGDTQLNPNWKLMASVGLVDAEPVAGSENLVKSGGVKDDFDALNQKIRNYNQIIFLKKVAQTDSYSSLENALAAVPESYRVGNAIIIWRLPGTTGVINYFISSDVSNWNNTSLWEKIPWTSELNAIINQTIDSNQTVTSLQTSLNNLSTYVNTYISEDPALRCLVFGEEINGYDSGGLFFQRSDILTTSYIFPVKPGISIEFKYTGTGAIQYSFATKYPIIGSSIQYCDGWSRTAAASNTLVTLTAPSDAKYFILIKRYNTDFSYNPLTFNGYNVPLINNFGILQNSISELSQSFESFSQDIQQDIQDLNQSQSVQDTFINPIKNLGDWALKYNGVNAYSIFQNDIILSQDGDSIEIEFSVESSGPTVGGYSWIGKKYKSLIGIGVSRTNLCVRSDDDTWILLNTAIRFDTNKHKLKMEYVNSNILIYVDDVLFSTYTGQKTITLTSIGNANTSYGYWKGNIYSIKVNSEDYNIFSQKIYNVESYRDNYFLTDSQAEKLDNAVRYENLYVQKTSDAINVFKRQSDNKFIKYPIVYRYRAFEEGVYLTGIDNWGMNPLYYSEMNTNGEMVDIMPLFSGGEAEVALTVPRGDGVSGFVFSGGAAHGFDQIIVDETGKRHFTLLINEQRIGESDTVSLQPCQKVQMIEEEYIYQPYSNTNPFATVTKIWTITESDVILDVNMKFIRSIEVGNAYAGMFCVLEHYNGDANDERYITSRAIKNNYPFKEYIIEDFWMAVEYNTWVANHDYNIGDVVINDNSYYVCTVEHTSESTFNPNNWSIINSWEANTQYNVNDYCYNTDSSVTTVYKSAVAHTSGSSFVKKWVNDELVTFDVNCTKITEYGNQNLGFSMEYVKGNRGNNCGMKVTYNAPTNRYNKIYNELMSNITPNENDEYYATIRWCVE